MSVYLGSRLINLIEPKVTSHLGCLPRTFFTTCCVHSKLPPASEILDEKNRKECLERIQRIKMSPREPSEDNRKRAAVLIPLCTTDNKLSLLYTLRRADLKRHRGQVSFPGGIEDPEDKSLEETALRETEEELGLKRDLVELWGSGPVIFGLEFTIQPVVGYLGDIKISNLKPSLDEVESVFTLSLEHLCEKENFRYTQFRSPKGKGYVLPVFINGPHRVWGMTGLITHVFLSSLLPDYYKNKLKYIASPDA